MSKQRLRVWWVPQMPCPAFEVEVDSVAQGVFIMDVLARYDAFQFENNIKPDYSNAGGLQMWEGGEWIDWEDETGEYNDPAEYLEASK